MLGEPGVISSREGVECCNEAQRSARRRTFASRSEVTAVLTASLRTAEEKLWAFLSNFNHPVTN